MPGLSARRRKLAQAKTSPTWSYNLHNRPAFCTTDSSSDDEYTGVTPVASAVPPSEDARLLRELDLSSRPDDAVYKPNPWTIAKLNAASRLPIVKSPPVIRNQGKRSLGKQAKGQIVEAFESQASRPIVEAENSKLIPQSLRSKGSESMRLKSLSHPVSNESSSAVSAQCQTVSRLDEKITAIAPPDIKQHHLTTYPLPNHSIQSSCEDHTLTIPSQHAGFRPHTSSIDFTYENAHRYAKNPDTMGVDSSLSPLIPGSVPSTRYDNNSVTSVAYPVAFANSEEPVQICPREYCSPQADTLEQSMGLTVASALSSPIPHVRQAQYLPRLAASSPYRGSYLPQLPALPPERPILSLPSSEGLAIGPRDTSVSISHASAREPDRLPRSPPPLLNAGLEPTPARPKFGRSSRQPYHDAYDAFPPSPDSNWSSLPLPAKRQRNAPEKRSGTFKIARLIRQKQPASAAGSTTEYSGSVKVTTYIPPPVHGPTKELEKLEDAKQSRGITSWSVKKAGHPYSSNLRKSHQSRMLSTASSGQPSGSKDTSRGINLPFDSQDLDKRYKRIRQAARERKHAETQLWHVLGLPSCGQVYLDNWTTSHLGHDTEVINRTDGATHKPLEIRIVTWNGSVY